VNVGRGKVTKAETQHQLYQDIKMWKESVEFPWQTYAEAAGKKVEDHLFEAFISNMLSNEDEDNELLLEIFDRMANPIQGGEIIYKKKKGVVTFFVSIYSCI
jgi:hypothetical protein